MPCIADGNFCHFNICQNRKRGFKARVLFCYGSTLHTRPAGITLAVLYFRQGSGNNAYMVINLQLNRKLLIHLIYRFIYLNQNFQEIALFNWDPQRGGGSKLPSGQEINWYFSERYPDCNKYAKSNIVPLF
jgi:hypothetical protein